MTPDLTRDLAALESQTALDNTIMRKLQLHACSYGLAIPEETRAVMHEAVAAWNRRSISEPAVPAGAEVVMLVAMSIESARQKAACFADKNSTFAAIEQELREASALLGPKSFINDKVVFHATPQPVEPPDDTLTPMSGFLVFLKDMRFTGSWDLPTLNRAIEVGETIAAQANVRPDDTLNDIAAGNEAARDDEWGEAGE